MLYPFELRARRIYFTRSCSQTKPALTEAQRFRILLIFTTDLHR